MIVGNEDQDAAEIRWATDMARHLGLDLASAPTKQQPRKPDVLLVLADGQRIGVEVVEVMNQQAKKGYAGTLTRVSAHVIRVMRQRGLNANVGLVVRDGGITALGRLKGDGEPALCRAIVSSVADALASPLPAGCLGWIYDDADPSAAGSKFHRLGTLSARGIKHLAWLQVVPYPEVRVITAVGNTVEGPQRVQSAIDEKAEKHPKYDQEGLRELWLLVVNGLCTGTSLGLPRIESHTFTSPFVRTLYLDCWQPTTCVALRTRAD